MSIQNCLPQLARQQYVRVRNQKSESARESYRAKLTDLRAQSAANGVLRSGYQELAEWKLAEELFGQLAYSWFEAAIETCKLYEIPLDQNLCKCIETDVRELLIGQYQNSLNHAGSPAGAVKVPLSARNKLSGHLQRCPFPIFNTIQIELEKERVESQRRRRDNMPRSLTPEERNILVALSDHPEQLQLDTLATRASMQEDQAGLLRALESLRIRGFVKFVSLRDGDALTNAANITILPSGLKFVEEAEFSDPARVASSAAIVSNLRGAKRRTAILINILIASPSDVSDERDVATEVIHAWNAAHLENTGIMLNPIRWETHSFPASGDRPQAIVNKQIVDRGDLLVGIFGYRLGTPTGEAQSGTIEEIERFRRTGKHVALYFSTADVPRDIDRDQLKALEVYQRERQADTLYFPFRSPEDLRKLLTQHLPKFVQEVHAKLQLGGELTELKQEIQNIENKSGSELAAIAGMAQDFRKERMSLKANIACQRLAVPGGGDDELYMLQVGVENDGEVDATDFQLDVEIPAHFLDGGGHRLQVPSERSGFALFRINNEDVACQMAHLYPGKKTKDNLIYFNFVIRGLIKFQQPILLQEKVTATVFSGNTSSKTELTIAELTDKAAR